MMVDLSCCLASGLRECGLPEAVKVRTMAGILGFGNRFSELRMGWVVEEPGEEPAGNRRPDGKFAPGNSVNPAGRSASRKWEEKLAERDRLIAELQEKLADRGLREENKVLKVRVKDLEAEVERLGRENAELRGRADGQADADPGADEIDGQIERMLLEAKSALPR